MFVSFFPRPKLFFLSAAIWIALAMAVWYGFVRHLVPDRVPVMEPELMPPVPE